MNDLLRKGRAWAPVLKSAVLFVLPAPLLLAVSCAARERRRASTRDDQRRTRCLWGAGALSWRALVAEARYFLGERTDPPRAAAETVRRRR